MLTEQEAKTKWCPLARGVWRMEHADGGSSTNYTLQAANRGEGYVANSRCIGSACMAWRLSNETRTLLRDDAHPGPEWERGDEDRIGKTPVVLWKRKRGYCGAFGRAE